jgi:hypothetical protein
MPIEELEYGPRRKGFGVMVQNGGGSTKVVSTATTIKTLTPEQKAQVEATRKATEATFAAEQAKVDARVAESIKVQNEAQKLMSTATTEQEQKAAQMAYMSAAYHARVPQEPLLQVEEAKKIVAVQEAAAAKGQDLTIEQARKKIASGEVRVVPSTTPPVTPPAVVPTATPLPEAVPAPAAPFDFWKWLESLFAEFKKALGLKGLPEYETNEWDGMLSEIAEEKLVPSDYCPGGTRIVLPRGPRRL